MSKKKENTILERVHKTAQGLRKAGLIDAKTMTEFDAACLPPVKAYNAREIKRIRKRFNISQPIFAAYLNTSANTVKQWEQGARKSSSIALKMLSIVDAKGIEVLA